MVCDVTGGTANPLGPFIEGLRALTNEDRRGARAKRIVEILGKLALLLELVLQSPKSLAPREAPRA